jgi:hypothetical protein
MTSRADEIEKAADALAAAVEHHQRADRARGGGASSEEATWQRASALRLALALPRAEPVASVRRTNEDLAEEAAGCIEDCNLEGAELLAYLTEWAGNVRGDSPPAGTEDDPLRIGEPCGGRMQRGEDGCLVVACSLCDLGCDGSMTAPNAAIVCSAACRDTYEARRTHPLPAPAERSDAGVVSREHHDRVARSRRDWIEAATAHLGPDWNGGPDDLRAALHGDAEQMRQWAVMFGSVCISRHVAKPGETTGDRQETARLVLDTCVPMPLTHPAPPAGASEREVRLAKAAEQHERDIRDARVLAECFCITGLNHHCPKHGTDARAVDALLAEIDRLRSSSREAKIADAMMEAVIFTARSDDNVERWRERARKVFALALPGGAR